MYGFPKAVWIAHDALVQHLESYGYCLSRETLGILTHVICPINFILVVHDFGVEYLGKEHALHLKSALKDIYKVTTDWEGKLYIGIALK